MCTHFNSNVFENILGHTTKKIEKYSEMNKNKNLFYFITQEIYVIRWLNAKLMISAYVSFTECDRSASVGGPIQIIELYV